MPNCRKSLQVDGTMQKHSPRTNAFTYGVTAAREKFFQMEGAAFFHPPFFSSTALHKTEDRFFIYTRIHTGSVTSNTKGSNNPGRLHYSVARFVFQSKNNTLIIFFFHRVELDNGSSMFHSYDKKG